MPKQGETDQAYKDGYKKGREHGFNKGHLAGSAHKEQEPETVASVIADFLKSLERVTKVLNMEIEELEE